MNRNNNIDDIFKEGMTGYSETPPAYVWDAIESKLNGERKNRKALIFWRGTAAAAVLGLLFLGGLIWNSLSDKAQVAINTPTQVISNTNNKTNTYTEKLSTNSIITNTKEKQQTTSPVIKNTKRSNSHTHLSYTEHASINDDDQNTSKEMTVPGKLTPINPILLASNAPIDASQVFFKNNSQLATKAIDRIFNFAYAAEKSDNEAKKEALQLALGGQFSPTYSYRETSNSASNEEGIISYTGGINLSIKTRKRWHIETGVYYAQVGQKFNNSLNGGNSRDYYFSAPAIGNINSENSSPDLSNSMGNIKLDNSSAQRLKEEAYATSSTVKLNDDENSFVSQDLSGVDVRQELDYIEIPFLVRYNLIEKSFGLSVSGGMSTNFLIGNNAYQVENNSKNRIGEMESINNISYSAIVGFGVRTPLLKSLDFSLEPKLRYYINSVSNAAGTNYKPYSIGIYTGISYKF